MKCLKCGYLGFETGDRCRNCGYDFSLTGLVSNSDLDDRVDDDLTLRSEHDTAGPFTDVSLREEFDSLPPPDATPSPDLRLDLDKLIGLPEPDGSVPARPTPDGSPPPRSTAAPHDEPLFTPEPGALDAPLPRPRAAPRPPLAVRRSTPEVPRVRPRTTPRKVRPDAQEAPPLAGLGLPVEPHGSPVSAIVGASPVRRVAAALIDLAVLGAIDGVVLYFTSRLAGIEPGEMTLLPLAPLASFFLLLNGGYFVTFGALGGQTIGQMALGLKLVGSDGLPVAFGTATLRTAAWLVFALPLGLGLWFALAADHRALHDRLTATRVVPS
jgi:uncharacterized RDD family membrane protein YckC